MAKIQAQFSNVYRKKSLHGLDTLISKNRSRGAGISGKLFQNRNPDPIIGLGREGRRLYPGDASLLFPSETLTVRPGRSNVVDEASCLTLVPRVKRFSYALPD